MHAVSKTSDSAHARQRRRSPGAKKPGNNDITQRGGVSAALFPRALPPSTAPIAASSLSSNPSRMPRFLMAVKKSSHSTAGRSFALLLTNRGTRTRTALSFLMRLALLLVGSLIVMHAALFVSSSPRDSLVRDRRTASWQQRDGRSLQSPGPDGRFVFSPVDAPDVFLLRPNWRRADLNRRSYAFTRVGSKGSGTLESRSGREELHHAKSSVRWRLSASDSAEGDDTAKLRFSSNNKALFVFQEKILVDEVDRARDYHDREHPNLRGQRSSDSTAESASGRGASKGEAEIAQPNALDDADQIRVLIVAFTTNMDDLVCSVAASAYLSGLPIVLVGYEHHFRNHTDKQIEVQKAAKRAGMRPQDVIAYVDADVLFLSGQDFVQSLDRFIRYSPESQVELDARDVRDDNGEMLAPVLFTAEHKCSFIDLFGKLLSKPCEREYFAYGMEEFDLYMQKVFTAPGAYHSKIDNTFRFLNSGGLVARVWAYDAFMTAFEQFPKTAVSVHGRATNQTGLWECDQSVAGAVYLSLLRFEARSDIFNVLEDGDLPLTENGGVSEDANAKRGNTAGEAAEADEAAAEARVNKSEKRKSRRPLEAPFGLPAGLISVDYANEFFTVVSYRKAYYSKFNDRYWRASVVGRHEKARREKQQREEADSTSASHTPSSSSHNLPPWAVTASPIYSEREGDLARDWLALREGSEQLFSLSFRPKSSWCAEATTNTICERRLWQSSPAGVPPLRDGAFALLVDKRYFYPRTSWFDSLDEPARDTPQTDNNNAAVANIARTNRMTVTAADANEDGGDVKTNGADVQTSADAAPPGSRRQHEQRRREQPPPERIPFHARVVKRPLEPFVSHCLLEAFLRLNMGEQRQLQLHLQEAPKAGLVSQVRGEVRTPSTTNDEWRKKDLLLGEQRPHLANGPVRSLPAPTSDAFLAGTQAASVALSFLSFVQKECILCRRNVDWFALSQPSPLNLSHLLLSSPTPQSSQEGVGFDDLTPIASDILLFSHAVHPSLRALGLFTSPPIVSVDLFPPVPPIHSSLRTSPAMANGGNDRERAHALRAMHSAFPALLHFTGRWKRVQRQQFLPMASWAVPLFFEDLYDPQMDRRVGSSSNRHRRQQRQGEQQDRSVVKIAKVSNYARHEMDTHQGSSRKGASLTAPGAELFHMKSHNARKHWPRHEQMWRHADAPTEADEAAENRMHADRSGFEKVKQYLATRTIELWGDELRTRANFAALCHAHTDDWFAERNERRHKRPLWTFSLY